MGQGRASEVGSSSVSPLAPSDPRRADRLPQEAPGKSRRPYHFPVGPFGLSKANCSAAKQYPGNGNN